MGIDHRKLLSLYMRLVDREESVTFLYDHLWEESATTPDEWLELKAIEKEISDERAAAHAAWLASRPPAPPICGHYKEYGFNFGKGCPQPPDHGGGRCGPTQEYPEG